VTAGEKKPATLKLQELRFSRRVDRALSLLSGLERALVAQPNLLTQIFQQDTLPALSSVALPALPRGSCCQSRCSRHLSANVQQALPNVKAVAANGPIAGREHLPVPADSVERAPGAEIKHRHILIDLEREHRPAKEIGHHVMAGEATHGTRELTRHDAGMDRIDQATGDVAGGKHIRHAGDAHELIDDKAV
jgi:hypothetical protein